MAAAPHLLGEAELELLGDPLGLPLLRLPLMLLLYGVGDGVAPLDDGELDGEVLDVLELRPAMRSC